MPSTRAPRTRTLFFGAALALSVVVALLAMAIVSYASANAWVEHTVTVERTADEWLSSVLAAETGARGYFISGRLEFLEPFNGALPRERAYSRSLAVLVSDTPEQLHAVEQAEQDAEAAIARLEDGVALLRAGHKEEALAGFADGEAHRGMDAFRRDIQNIRNHEKELLAERRSRARSRAVLTLFAAAVLALASYAFLMFAWHTQKTRSNLLDQLAREARRRLDTLSDVAVALSEARTRAQVAKAVVDLGMRAAGADTCTLYMLDDSGTSLDLIGERGVAAEILDEIRILGEGRGHGPTYEAFQSGTTLWVENEAEYAALFPAISSMKASGPRAKAFWCVPLIAEGRAVGLLGMGFYEPRGFSADERAFVKTLTNQCAQSLLRAARMEQEDVARTWFTTTLRSIGDAVIATDEAGHITFMNPIAERLTGFAESEARGKKLEDVFRIFSEQTQVPAESPAAKVLSEGAVVGLANHTVLVSKNGTEVPIHDSGAPIKSEGGELLGVVLVFRDATSEKKERVRREFLARAGEALVSSLDYHGILATVAKLAVPALADFCTVDVLPRGSEIADHIAVAHVDPEKARLARALGERYPRDPKARRGVPEVMRTGNPELYESIGDDMIVAAARDAEHLRLLRELDLKSAMIVPLRARGRTYGAMTFVYAESGRRYSAEDLAFAGDFARRATMAIENGLALLEVEEARAHEQSLRNAAEVASHAKDEFLAMVSHELRTPLTAILGWAVMLRDRRPVPDIDRGLAVIERNARAQTKLIEDVLDVSRIISGKLSLSIGPTDVGEVVSTAIETVTPASRAKDIAISAEIAPSGLAITADADRLQQIVWNLLSNAVKFTPKGGRVEVVALREGSEVCISAKDTGEGIRADALPFVFEPFRQADASTTRRHGGLGLGLAIVKQLASAHGGTVVAESAGEGKGATFTVRLPALSAVPAIGRASRPPAGAEPASARAGAPRLDGLRILAVDDEIDALELVGGVLREQGAEVHTVNSPASAVETFTRVLPDIVVSDIGMPQMDGYALIRKIRALPPELGGRTPAVALTAYARAEDAQRAFAAGYQMHVTKPVEPAQLATVLANLGGRSLEH